MSGPYLPPSTGSVSGSQIELSATPVPLTVQYAPRSVTMHTVSSTELDTVASLSNSVHLAFFGLCSGSVVAFGIVLSTAKINDPMTHAGYVALLAVSVVGTLYFGVRALIDYKEAKRKLREIKSGK